VCKVEILKLNCQNLSLFGVTFMGVGAVFKFVY
jgi:hypothetical protein